MDVEARILAKTGFYLTGPKDHVKCYFCKVENGCWEIEDDAVTEHIRWSPNCALLKHCETTNKPIEPIDELDRLLPPLSYDVCGSYGINIRPGSYPGNQFPTVSSIQSNEINPILIEQESRVFKHAEHAEYIIESVRFNSFDTWPRELK